MVVWWETALVALASSVAGGALSWLGSFLSLRAQTQSRRREEAGRLVGEALAALRELDPDVYLQRLQLEERGREKMQEKADRWLRAAGGLEVLRASRPELGEVGALVLSVLKDARLVVLRMTEQMRGDRYPNDPWWNAVRPAYERAIDDLERILRQLDGVGRP